MPRDDTVDVRHTMPVVDIIRTRVITGWVTMNQKTGVHFFAFKPVRLVQAKMGNTPWFEVDDVALPAIESWNSVAERVNCTLADLAAVEMVIGSATDASCRASAEMAHSIIVRRLQHLDIELACARRAIESVTAAT